MFKCQKCQKSAARPNRIAIERKMVQHLPEPVGPRGGYGSQIVREISVCDECKAITPAALIERAEAVETVTVNGAALDSRGDAA